MTEIASDAIDQLATALAKAQGEMTNPKKDKTAKVKMRSGDGYEYKYSDLASVRDIVMPILASNGIAVVQFTEVVMAGMLLHTRFVHTSGQWIESTYPIVISDRPQDVGSAISYGRRYCLSSMCGIASEDDDDAQIAQGGAWNGQAKPPPGVPHPRHVYAQLVESLRRTKNEAEYAEWKRKHEHEAASLDEVYDQMLLQAMREHRAAFGKATLAEKAIAVATEQKHPMPDDEIRVE